MDTKPKFVDSCLCRFEYSGGEKAGTVAKKYNVAVGEIGCKNCGVTIVGAIYENECGWCGKPLI